MLLLPYNNCFASAALPEVACLYRTITKDLKYHHKKTTDKTSQWHLWRYKNKIQIRNLETPIGEIWQQLKGGDIAYSWLFHDKKFVINYTSSDLKAIKNNPNWLSKANIISPELLKRLTHQSNSRVLGYIAENYVGKIGEFTIEVTWLPKLKIPAAIKQTTATQKTLVMLEKVYPYSDSPWKPVNIDNYQDMDFADIGDNEADPLLNFYMEKMSFISSFHHH